MTFPAPTRPTSRRVIGKCKKALRTAWPKGKHHIIEEDHNDNYWRANDARHWCFRSEIDGREFLITVEDITLESDEQL